LRLTAHTTKSAASPPAAKLYQTATILFGGVIDLTAFLASPCHQNKSLHQQANWIRLFAFGSQDFSLLYVESNLNISVYEVHMQPPPSLHDQTPEIHLYPTILLPFPLC